MLLMWEEKVDRLWAMDCSSPMSASTRSQTVDDAPVPGGDVQAALGHEGQQTEGLEGDGLTAGVGAGDDQGIEGLPQAEIDGLPPSWGSQQGVPRPA